MNRISALVPTLVLLACSSPPPGQDVSLLEFHARAPAAWKSLSPANPMRLAEFALGEEDGAPQVVVFYFGQGQGGSVEANVARWQNQFTGPDGGPVQADVTTVEGTAFPTTVADLQGSYARGMGMGPGQAAAEPDQALVAAVVETPRGSLFAQLFGSRESVAAAREGFLDFVRSIGPQSGP